MSIVNLSETNYSPEVAEAEWQLNNALDSSNEGFVEGVQGGHEDFWSWFSSGLTGAAVSKGMDEEGEKALYIKRNGAEHDIAKLNDAIDKARKLRELRGFTEEEAQNVLDLIERKDNIEAALGVAYDLHGGDLDGVIYDNGNSFNDEWGMGDNEAGLIEFIDGIRKNPTYGAGMLVGEMLKDAPLSLLAWLGMGAKGVTGGSAITKVINKLNGIESKALRGLSKVATPVAVGAVAGATYEAAYSNFNEGKVKWDDVQTGTEFGAAFGVFGALGMFGKRAGVESPTGDTPTKSAKEAPTTAEIKDMMDNLLDDADHAEVKSFGAMLVSEHNTKIFPELGVDDYVLMNVDEAVKFGFERPGNKDIQAYTTKHPTLHKDIIVWDEAEIDKKWKEVMEGDDPFGQGGWLNKTTDWRNTKEGALAPMFSVLSPRHLLYLQDKNIRKAFIIAHEKAHILQRKGWLAEDDYKGYDGTLTEGERSRVYNTTKYDDRVPGGGSLQEERSANIMAARELDRIFKEHKVSQADKSAIAAKQQAESYIAQQEGADYLPKNHEAEMAALKKEELREGVEPGSKVMDYLNKNKVLSSSIAAGTAYAITNEEDAPYAALGAVAAVIGGPKAYKALLSTNIPQEVAKAKLQASKAHEGLAAYSKGLNTVGQELGDAINAHLPGRGDEFLQAVEKGLKFKGDDVANDLVKQWKHWTAFLGRQGVEVGLFKAKNGDTQLLTNYVPHLIKGKFNDKGETIPLTQADMDNLVAEMAERIQIKGTTKTVHQIPRKLLGDIEALKKQGYDVVDDAGQVLSIYTQALTRAIHNRKLLSELTQLDLGNRERPLPGLMTLGNFDKFVSGERLTPKEQLLYSEFDHPALKGYKVHNNIKQILNHHFEVRREGGIWGFTEGLLTLNNSLKRVFVFGSLFHASALFMSSVYSLGASGAVKGLLGKGKMNDNHNWAEFKLGTTEFKEAAKEAMRAGLQIINIRNKSLVNVGKAELDNVLDHMGGFGELSKKAFDGIDTITWEYMHDRYKLAAYLRHKEVLMTKWNIDDAASSKMAAEFANDAYGSLDWDNFATRLHEYAYNNNGKLRGKIADTIANILPANNRRFLNLGLFAPDWTISNIRIIGKTFTLGHKITKKFVKDFHRGQNWNTPEGQQMLKSWNMYAAYAGRAGVYTSAMWWTFTELFSDEEPSMEAFAEFWAGETSGKLQLGNGESMVISKQIAEPIHWIQHPQHTLMNKASVIPKTMMEGMFNKQWFSMKKGFPMGPPIVDDDGTTHYGKWGTGKLVPIVVKPFMDDSLKWQEKFERVATGFVGLPQYGTPDN